MGSVAKAGPKGQITLPETMRSFFAEGEEVEVFQHQHHVALWKRWEKVLEARGGKQKVTRKNAYLEAAKRISRVVEKLATASPEVALYLGGYVVECRLKWSVCVQWGKDYLDEAEYLIGQYAGCEYSLTGGSGHDLKLLLELAGDQALLNEKAFHEAWDLCLQWTTNWRYWLPRNTVKVADTYLTAFRTVYEKLGEAR